MKRTLHWLPCAAALVLAACGGPTPGKQAPPAAAAVSPQPALPPLPEIQPADRTIVFPDEPDVGRIYVSDWEARVDDQSSVDRAARGAVAVPRDLEVYLWIDQARARDLSFLDGIGPDDVQGIIFPRLAPGAAQPLPQDEITRLGRLTGLRSLDFAAVSLAGCSLEPIAGLARLERLHLGLAQIGDDALTPLASLKSLRHLDLQSTAITDAGLGAVARMQRLEHLNLARTAVTDAGVANLAPLSRLRVLFLAHTGLTDASVEPLAKLGSLETLYLFDTLLTAKGLDRLRAALPKCRIFPQVPPPRVTPSLPAHPSLPVS